MSVVADNGIVRAGFDPGVSYRPPVSPSSDFMLADSVLMTAPPTSQRDRQALILRKHPEYVEFLPLWQRILDTMEGGDRYRFAEYPGTHLEKLTGVRARNLIRLERELPPPPASLDDAGGPFDDLGAYQEALRDRRELAKAAEESYSLRLVSTPVPTFLGEIIDKQISHIYSMDATRTGGPALDSFWQNTDGKHTDMKEFMRQYVAPLLLPLGLLDVMVEPPARPVGEPEIATGRGGLPAVVARYILPENMPWWRLASIGSEYLECVVKEWQAAPDGRMVMRYRYWNAFHWATYEADAKLIEWAAHPYRRVPIVRVFDRRNSRADHAAHSRYIGIVEKSHAYYNSDALLNEVNRLQSAPLLTGPPDDETGGTGGGQTVPVGSRFMLKNGRSPDGKTVYEYGYISPSMEPQKFIRQRLVDLLDQMQNSAGLVKPAGATGGTGQVVAQSGISKKFDTEEGRHLLSGIAQVLASAEWSISELALWVASGGQGRGADGIEIRYPTSFAMDSFKDVSERVAQFLEIAASAKAIEGLPTVKARMLFDLLKYAMPDETPEFHEIARREIAAFTGATVE